jgi:hypothetical protein
MTTTPVLLLLAAVRIVHLSGGATATITPQSDGAQQVVIKDAKGNVAAESYCDLQSGYYDQIVKFQQALVAAARNNDRLAMISLVQYPLRVNVSSSNRYFIKDAPTLKARFQTVFPPRILGYIRRAEPQNVFCRMGMSMVGGGVMWATVDNHGVLKAQVINQ